MLPRVKSIFIDDWDSTPWLRQPEVVARGAALMRKVVEIMTQEEASAEWNETKGIILIGVVTSMKPLYFFRQSHQFSMISFCSTGLLACHMFDSAATPAAASSSSSSVSRRGLFPLLLSIGSSLPRGCQIHAADSAFLDDLFQLAAAPAVDAALATDAAKLSAAIVNKIDHDAALTSALDQVVAIVVGEGRKGVSANGVRLWIWVTKALVIRSHRCSKQFTGQLVEWLVTNGDGVCRETSAMMETDKKASTSASDPTEAAGANAEEVIPMDAADTASTTVEEIATLVSRTAFVTILADSDDVFSARQHAISRKMFKQRFFLQTAPSLIRKPSEATPKAGGEGEKAETSKSEQHRLNALASMLPYLPQQALLSELPSILPVLVKVRRGRKEVDS